MSENDSARAPTTIVDIVASDYGHTSPRTASDRRGAQFPGAEGEVDRTIGELRRVVMVWLLASPVRQLLYSDATAAVDKASVLRMSQKISVLVVEDEVLILMDIADQLAEAGYNVFEASNADQAVAILERETSIRILFTDIDMPGSMDGLKLAAAVRDRWPPVKIVLTSGHRLVDITDLPDGCVFHSKPYHHETVAASFRELLI